MSAPKLVVKDHGFGAFFARARDLARLRTAKVKIGVLSDTEKGGMHAREPDGKSSPLTLAEIFAILHFGTKDGRIPKSPVLTDTLDKERPALAKLGAQLMAGVIFGELTLEAALGLMGAKMASDVKSAIAAGVEPPNAPSTAIAKAMKGRTARFFKQGRQRHIGDALADAAATKYVEGLGGYGRGGRKAVGAARSLGHAFAQIGAIAAVKRYIDTGRLVGAITWAIVMNGETE